MVYENGNKQISSFSLSRYSNKVGLLLGQFRSIQELNWYKAEITKIRDSGTKGYTGQNTFECYVDGDICEVGHQNNRKDYDTIPTKVVLAFIDQAIEFHEKLNAGNIPGVIPDSKKDDWLIVPKEFVKDQYFDKDKKDIKHMDQ